MSTAWPETLERWLLGLHPGLRLRWGVRDTETLGRLGESIAEIELRRRGARILGRRLRTPRGELDLWIQVHGLGIGVEVKTSRAPGPREVGAWRTWRPGRRLTQAGIQRRRRAVEWVLGRSGLGGQPTRLDLIEVWVHPTSPWIHTVHHQDIRSRLPRNAPLWAPSAPRVPD